MKKEPAIWLGAVGAAIALGVSFGLPVSAEQVGFIMAFVSAVLALVTRQLVSPAASVVAQKVDGLTVAGPAMPTVSAGLPVAVSPLN